LFRTRSHFIHQQGGDHWRELSSVERIPAMLVLGLKDIF